MRLAIIELFSFLGLLLLNINLKNLPYFPIVINSYSSITIAFIVFGNFFVFVAKNLFQKPNKRYLFLCSLYTMLIVISILSLFYFSYYVENLFFIKLTIQILLYGSMIFSIIYLKYYEIWKRRKSYSKMYYKLQITYTFLLILLLIIDYFQTASTLNNFTTISCLVLVFGLFVIHSIINRFSAYWQYNEMLLNKLENLMSKGKTNKAIIPPIREVENDFILSDIRYILNESVVRYIEVPRIIKKVRSLMIKRGYSQKDITTFTDEFYNVININLMKRKDDYDIFQTSSRIKKDRRKS